LIAQSYAKTFGVPVAITRCGNFYGGGDLNWNRIVPGTIRSIVRGKAPIIRSDGKFIRDYIYVEDAAAAYMLLAESLAHNPELKGEAFNFSYEQPMSVVALVSEIMKITGSRLKPEIRNEASHEIRDQHLNARKAKKLLGWTPIFSFKEGLKKTVKWYKDFLREGK